MTDKLISELSVVIPFVISIFTPMAVFLGKWLVSHLPESRQAQSHGIRSQAQSIIESCVSAIEQTRPNFTGVEKKAECLRTVQTVLSSLHLKVPDQLVDVLIESTVSGLNGGSASSTSTSKSTTQTRSDQGQPISYR